MQNDSKLSLSGDWILQKEEIYSVNDTEVRYYAAATGHYEDLGMKQISVAAGTFESAMIKSVAKINFIQIIYWPHGNASVTTRGEITGTYWIDAKTGMVIKTDHSVSKVLATEQHELYQNKGFPVDLVYREIPRKSRIMCELNTSHTAGFSG